MKKKLGALALAVGIGAGISLAAASPAFAGGGNFSTHASCMAWYKAAQEAGEVHDVYYLCVPRTGGYYLYYV